MKLRALALLAVLHLLAATFFLHACGWGFPLDDAWGHLVYGRALATWQGLAYNPGQPEAGVTSPLWTYLCALPAGLVEWHVLARITTRLDERELDVDPGLAQGGRDELGLGGRLGASARGESQRPHRAVGPAQPRSKRSTTAAKHSAVSAPLDRAVRTRMPFFRARVTPAVQRNRA